MILAFSVALKHKLRFEPYAHYEDIASLLNHLTTYAQEAHDPEFLEAQSKKHSFFKRTGEYLGVSFAESNPRKAIKRASKPVGNLPLEILTFLSVYAEGIVANKTLASPIVYGQVCMFFLLLKDRANKKQWAPSHLLQILWLRPSAFSPLLFPSATIS